MTDLETPIPIEDIVFELGDANPALLAEELRDALGACSPGVSWRGGVMRVHIHAPILPQDRARVESVRAAHNPSRLTRAEQVRADLHQQRQQHRDALDPRSVSLEALARRVAWLEAELRQLRELEPAAAPFNAQSTTVKGEKNHAPNNGNR